MINRIISFSIKNKFIVGLLVLALIGGGVYSMSTINLGSVPDITNNQVQVITVSQNLSTEDVEQFVTYPVELAMANLPSVEEIRSISRFGLSVVTIVFKDNMGIYLPRQLVQEKLNEVDIPQQFGSPFMGPISTGLGEIYQYSLVPKPGYDIAYTPMQLRSIQDWLVKRQLAMVPGVVEVNSAGGYIKQYEIAINPNKLNAMNITISDVFEALKRNNINTGGAYIERNKMANFIRGEGLVKSIDDLQNIAIKNVDGTPILIKDVAEKVHFGHMTRYGAFTQDGHEAVGGTILMLKGANPNSTVQNVKRRIESIKRSLPEGLTIKPFLDRSALIDRTTSTVSDNLIEGALIVFFVLILLLGSIRAGLITASVIPLSLLFAFILMKILGVWANLMSLGAIDFGIIIDGAVILVEVVMFTLMEKLRKVKQPLNGEEMNELTYSAISGRIQSVFFGQVIILIIFAPIIFLSGIEGKMFRPMAFTFAFAVLGAILLSVTYVPMMAALVLKPFRKSNYFSRLEDWMMHKSDLLIDWLFKLYQPLLRFSLKRKLLVIIIAVAVFCGAGFIFSKMGGVFIPSLDEGDIAMQAMVRPGSSLNETIRTSEQIENILKKNFPEIKTVTARIGVSEIPTDPMPMDICDMFIILEKDMDKWVSASSKEELIEKIKKKLAVLSGVNLVFSQPVELRFNELITGVREDVAIKLYGDDLDVLAQKAEEMAGIIRTVPGVGDVSPERTSGLPQMTVHFNRRKIAQYGLDIKKISNYISSMFAGGVAGVIFEGEKRFDLVVRFDKNHRKSIENLRNLYIDIPNGSQIPIKEVADINYQPGPMQISRDNTFRRVYVGVNTRGRDVESVVKDIQKKLDTQLKLPAGYHITYGGSFENLQEAKGRLEVVIPIALLIIFILLFFALQSFAQSIVIFMSLPLATIGGILLLWARGIPFSISAGVGFIVLFGVSVLNGLVLINRFNSLKLEYSDIDTIIFEGTKEVFRPVILAAAAAITGFIPMAFSASAGAGVQRPLATVVIGGLITATLLTLLVIPVLYRLWEGRKKRSATVKKTLISVGILILLAGSLSAFSTKASAQVKLPADSLPKIALREAVDKAIQQYPRIQAARLEIQNQEALKKMAWQLGNTSVFTGKEEVGQGAPGIYTKVGVQQDGIDIFGISSKMKVQNQRVMLAQKALSLNKLQLKREVEMAWGKAAVALNRYFAYRRLDSVFSDIRRAAEIRYQTEATSRLEYLSTVNQANEVRIRLKQVYRDYLSALESLNLWFADSSFYTVELSSAAQLEQPLVAAQDSLSHHPLLEYYRQNIHLANAVVKEKRAQFLPKVSGQYKVQQVDGENGFHAFEIGIQIPLFFMSQKGALQSAEIEQEISKERLREEQLNLNSSYKAALQEYQKWRESWQYYKNEALPLARQQQAGSLMSFREGEIDYITFLQNMRDAIHIETASWDAFGEYLNSRYTLDYYLTK